MTHAYPVRTILDHNTLETVTVNLNEETLETLVKKLVEWYDDLDMSIEIETFARHLIAGEHVHEDLALLDASFVEAEDSPARDAR